MIGIAEGKQIKSSMLPAYCDPPNPCPLGYTAQVIVVLVDDNINVRVDIRREGVLQSQLGFLENNFCSLIPTRNLENKKKSKEL